MKILLDHNEPFLLAHGGFQILIEKTAHALRDAGLEVEYLRWWDPGQTGDIIHFFGRANPGSIHFAHGKGMKYVMHELLTSQGSRSRSQLQIQGLMNRLLRRVLPSSFRLPLRWDSYKMADAVIASTQWEAWIMRTLFDVSPAHLHVVPTGVDDIFFLKAESGKWKVEDRAGDKKRETRDEGRTSRDPLSGISAHGNALDPRPSTSDSSAFSFQPSAFSTHPYLVTLATITERKRVVETAEAAVLAGVRLLVIGKPYSESDPYFLRFLECVRNSSGLVRYEAKLAKPEEISPILKTARGFVLLSTMETQSTAALAAAASGCPLLLTDLPWARTTFGENASYLKSSFVDEAGHRMLAATLGCFHDNAELLPVPPRPASWADVGSQLAAIYRAL